MEVIEIEQGFVNRDIALQMRNLKFDKTCIKHYYKESQTLFIGHGHEFDVPCPTYSQCFKFFREKYGYLHHITYFDPFKAQTPGNADYQGFVLFPHKEIHKLPKMNYNTYEEAEQACLIKLIELCQNQI